MSAGLAAAARKLVWLSAGGLASLVSDVAPQHASDAVTASDPSGTRK